MGISCPTCNSPRCGNHAACARKKLAQHQRVLGWHEGWTKTSAFLFWRMHLVAGTQPTIDEMATLREERPEVYYWLVRSTERQHSQR